MYIIDIDFNMLDFNLVYSYTYLLRKKYRKSRSEPLWRPTTQSLLDDLNHTACP